MPPQLREIGCHVQNHATQWHDFQHEIQFQEIGVAWIQLTLYLICLEYPFKKPCGENLRYDIKYCLIKNLNK